MLNKKIMNNKLGSVKVFFNSGRNILEWPKARVASMELLGIMPAIVS